MERANKESKVCSRFKVFNFVNSYAKRYVEQLLNNAGIQLNGNHPADMQVHDSRLYLKLLLDHELAIGESYVNGWWDSEQLDEFFYKIYRHGIEKQVKKHPLFLWSQFCNQLRDCFATLRNFQTKSRATQVGEVAYDLGNDLFLKMLDQQMNYTCAYWKNAHTLDEAQTAKLELICQKLNLKAGQRILDIGCGFGGFARYAAENYKVSVIGVTISQEQLKFAKEYCKHLPVEIRFQDYREVKEKFDRIVSIGMFEHVGYKNYRTFFKVVEECLNPEGILLLQTIGNNYSLRRGNKWVEKYIFPNGMLPSIKQIGKATENLLIMEDWHNFGFFYDHTLMAWHQNFLHHWNELKNNYDSHFYRLWNFYLLSAAGAFRAREVQLWQIVFSKSGIRPSYNSVR